MRGIAIPPHFPKTIDIRVVQPENRVACGQVRVSHPPPRSRTDLPMDGVMRRQLQRARQMTKMNGRGTAEKTAWAGGPKSAKARERDIAGAEHRAARVRHRVSEAYEKRIGRPVRECRVAERRGSARVAGFAGV